MSMAQNPEQIAARAQAPGLEGVIFRLAQAWPPNNVGLWLASEAARHTQPLDTGRALGNLIGSVVWAYAESTSNAELAFQTVMTAAEVAIKAKAAKAGLPNRKGLIIPGAE